LFLQNSPRSGRTPPEAAATLAAEQGKGLYNVDPNVISTDPLLGRGRQFTYTEYSYQSPVYAPISGGVASCSSQDLKTFRFEGFVLYYNNLTDMVFNTNGTFVLAKPTVLFNNATKMYVMWATMDNALRSINGSKVPPSGSGRLGPLAISTTASSPYEDGPFLLSRSFYPDGNYTRDQKVFINDENRPVLVRTYYQTVEFLLPRAVMQPVWESVKFRNGSVNFRNSYHRTIYNVNYDDIHDIKEQVWRKENIPWEVKCVNKITGKYSHIYV
jgi:hypothetical protein